MTYTKLKFPIKKEDLTEKNFSLFTNIVYITRIVDGDTVEGIVDRGFGETQERRFRVYQEEGTYFDTPEISKYRGVTDAHKEHGLKAKKRAEELLLNKFVYVKSHKRGSFRYLGEIFLEDGTSYVDVMIKEGFQKKENYE